MRAGWKGERCKGAPVGNNRSRPAGRLDLQQKRKEKKDPIRKRPSSRYLATARTFVRGGVGHGDGGRPRGFWGQRDTVFPPRSFVVVVVVKLSGKALPRVSCKRVPAQPGDPSIVRAGRLVGRWVGESVLTIFKYEH